MNPTSIYLNQSAGLIQSSVNRQASILAQQNPNVLSPAVVDNHYRQSRDTTPIQFISYVNQNGINVKNNFEVEYSAIQGFTFMVQGISIPGIRHNFVTVSFNGRDVEVPTVYEYERDAQLTVLGDANGTIFGTLYSQLLKTRQNKSLHSRATLTLRALTGDRTCYQGSIITLRSFRISNISGFEYGQSDSSIQTFTVGGKFVDFGYSIGNSVG